MGAAANDFDICPYLTTTPVFTQRSLGNDGGGLSLRQQSDQLHPQPPPPPTPRKTLPWRAMWVNGHRDKLARNLGGKFDVKLAEDFSRYKTGMIVGDWLLQVHRAFWVFSDPFHRHY